MKQPTSDIFIHPNAIIDTDHIGQATRIWAYVHVLSGAIIGTNCNICDFVFIENDVILGNNVTVKSGVQLWDGIVIEDDVFIGPNVTFVNDIYPRSKQYLEKFPRTVLRRGSSIGANSVLLAGIEVGKYAMIGAGAVVTKNVGNYQMFVGNPAKPKGLVCRCGTPVEPGSIQNLSYICSCGDQYMIKGATMKSISDGP